MSSSLYQWRCFVGPEYVPSDEVGYFRWSDLWNFPIDLETTYTTLAATLDATSTTATLTSDAALRTIGGGVWIGPNGAGEGWEFCKYNSITAESMTGLVREPAGVRAHNGAHSIGSVVKQWWQLTGADGRLHFTEQLDRDMSAITWTAQLSGLLAPAPALRANHIVVIQTRANLGTWEDTLIGFCRQPRIRDTYERLREWSLDIVCAAQIIDNYRTKSIRVGAMNLAEFGSASTDTCLIEALKERMSGDFISSAPTLTGQSAIDGDDETLWIAERLRGTTRSVALPDDPIGGYLGAGGFCTMARLWRFPGEAKGHRYLEFVAGGVGELRTWPNMWLGSKTGRANPYATVLVMFEGLETQNGDLIILAENKDTFEAANPLSEAIAVIEIGSPFFDSLDLAGDAIAIVTPGHNWMPTVAWGTGGMPQAGIDYGDGDSWTGDTPAAPTIGQIIRYEYTAAPAVKSDYFLVDLVDAPGYRSGGEDPWIQVALPLIGLAARDDMTAGSPGAGSLLYVTKGGSDGTEGLATSGTIQIGIEQITYSARSSSAITISARGANGTTAAAHAAGDMVRVVDGAIATQGQLIDAVGWTRPTGFPHPAGFTMRASNLDGARVPPDDNHTEDYTTLATVTGHASETYSLALDPPIRATFVILEIDHMSVDPYRPRVNEIQIEAAAGMFDSTLIMDATEAEYIIARVIQNTGFSQTAMLVTLSATTLDELITAEDASAWSVAADIAARCNVLLDCRRGGWIAIGPNDLPAGVLTAATTWTDVNASACEFVQTAATVTAQVKLPYRLPDGTTGEAKYPTEPSYQAGQILKLPEVRYPSAALALAAARRLYTLARYPLMMMVECAEEQPTLRPGAVARIQWSFADDTPQMDRLVIVTATDHEINAGIWTTVLTTTQVDREWAA